MTDYSGMIKQVTIRFYAELNDFLPSGKKKVAFSHSFKGNPAVKDVIESIGIPHTEIDMILVNGNSVDFGYLLKNNDYISVYPVCETFDISGVTHLRDKPLRNTKFILDLHLGKLAKYLRMCGFDTLYQNDYDDETIIQISNATHRIILTRDVGLLKTGSVSYGYFIRSQQPGQQLAEVLKHFDLFKTVEPFNRCIKCNGNLQSIEKQTILHQLEPNTSKYFDKFFICSQCCNIFWEGSHFERMKSFINNILAQQSDD